MMDDFTFVVAAPFKKSASQSLSIRDFEFSLSFDLKWMSPKEASRVRDKAIQSKLLKVDGLSLVPVFDLDSVDIPHGFKPSPEAFRERSTLEQIMDIIASTTQLDMKEIAVRINTKQEQYSDLVDIDIAALIVARELGCSISSMYSKIYANFMSKPE